MTTFQRARSDQAREIRRQAILDTTAQMLNQMPVNAVTLNEVSRRGHLAKSALLKYFESREAILLELLDQRWKQWIADVGEQLADRPDPDQPVQRRGADLAATLTRTLAERPQLCDLFSAQAGVLEHNVSAEVASRYKKAAFANVAALAEVVRARLPELGPAADQLCLQIMVVVGATWAHSRPSAAMLAAYDADPGLATHRIHFSPTLENLIITLVSGALTLASSTEG